MRKTLLVALLIVTLVLLGAACAQPAPSIEGITTATTAPQAKEPAAPAEAPRQQVVFGIWSEPKTFNPWITNDSYSWVAMDMMYRGLARLDENGEPVGDLAESWDISDDGLVYTFHLRGDATWHDGEPVTANDAVFSLTRLLGSVFANRFSLIQGADEFRAGETEQVAGLEAVDEHTFRVRLEAPLAPLLGHLSVQSPIMPAHLLGDVPSDDLETHPYFQNPVGNGPFEFVRYNSGQFVEFDAFDNFYLGRPNIDKLFVSIGAQDVLLAQLQRGEVDVAAVPPTEADRISGLSGIILYDYPSTIVQAININLGKPYLQDPRVRKAMAYALNTPEMVQTILGSYGETISMPLGA